MQTIDQDNQTHSETSCSNTTDMDTNITKEDLCKKMCTNILQGLLEGYEDLKTRNPDKTKEFQSKINELKAQIREKNMGLKTRL